MRILVTILCTTLFCAPSTYAASWESLINPGPLTQSHADLEEECTTCHSLFDQDNQSTLCLDCHEEIAHDLQDSVNYHGLNPAIRDTACSTCHTDHEGRDLDITGLVEATFDHNLTNFELNGSHTALACLSCHTPEESTEDTPSQMFRGTPAECVGCHEEDDAHAGGLGTDCASCHNENSWQEHAFDHAETTEYALVGAHSEQACSSCHIDNKYEDTPNQCIDCHKLDDVHTGSRGNECDSCHTSENWQANEFDHNAQTDFDLVGAHRELTCNGCHLQNMSLEQPPTTCIGCHSVDDVHAGARGTECADCHTNESWSVSFEHFEETGFALTNTHSSLRCESCHTTNLTDPLPSNCAGCHSEEDPHANTLGECDSCHAGADWTNSIRFDHEFTEFPLVGLHRVATCEQCHESLQFNTAEPECIACHENDDNHDMSLGGDCGTCHNPGGWALWDFNHDTQTSFALTGSHADLICASCHNKNSGRAENLSSTCVTCHAEDDIHNGSFGAECDQCHSTESFTDSVRFR